MTAKRRASRTGSAAPLSHGRDRRADGKRLHGVVVRVRLARDLARAQRCVSSLRGRRVEATVITGEQIRRARELLGWTPYRLAPRAGIGHTLLRQFERGARPIDAESAARLRAALEEAGVEFLGNGTGEGVRLRVCNGATVEFTDGEPRDASARNPS
jgi:Helix-turn-helix